MKKLLILFTILPLTVIGQERKDTIFLQNDKFGNNVFIDPSKNSENFSYLKNQFKIFPKTNFGIDNLALNWVPVQKYRGEFFLYMACDCFQPIIKISKAYIGLYCFEKMNFTITEIKNVKKNIFLINYKNHKNKSEMLKITLLSYNKGLAIFEFINEKKKSNYQLMANIESIYNFQIIINNCKNSKVNEFDFDHIDFSQLK